jgi:hypothetical protein
VPNQASIESLPILHNPGAYLFSPALCASFPALKQGKGGAQSEHGGKNVDALYVSAMNITTCSDKKCAEKMLPQIFIKARV